MRSLESKYSVSCDLTDAELDSYAEIENDRVIAKLSRHLHSCEGANTELERLASEGHFQLAVVSSSAMRRVRVSLETTGQDRIFDPAHVFSATDSLPGGPKPKPDPAVYLHALQVLGKTADECIAVEDSRSGVTAACRAGLVTIGYTGAAVKDDERQGLRAVLKQAGCKFVMDNWSEFRECLLEVTGGIV